MKNRKKKLFILMQNYKKKKSNNKLDDSEPTGDDAPVPRSNVNGIARAHDIIT